MDRKSYPQKNSKRMAKRGEKVMPHTHIIDNKIQTFDDTTCPFCHPEQQQLPKQDQQEQLPRAYRKGDTIVLKLSRVTLITTNFYKDKNCYLQSMSKIMRDNNGKVILGQDQKPLWNKQTVRIPIPTLKEWLMLLSTLASEIDSQQVAPKRD
jgi:hypothetical protein